MNEEYTPFEEWYETFERDGGELMLYNTIDLEAAFLAGAAAMREKCAEVAETVYDWNDFETEGIMGDKIAAAIREIEVE